MLRQMPEAHGPEARLKYAALSAEQKKSAHAVASMCVTHPLGPLAASSAASVAASLAAFNALAASAN